AKKLRAVGIHCQVFNKVLPFVTSSHNNRDHRKITVIDGAVAYTGGMNLADEYINEKIKYGHWKDSAIRLYGKGAWGFTVMFLHVWSMLTGKEEPIGDFYPRELPEVLSDGWVQPYSDSPIDRERVGEHVYSQIIEQAQRYLYITTPYLMVDDGLLAALKLSAKSGVDVRIITPSHPDKKWVHFTTRSYYRELIAAGVKIYEYSDGFMHAKNFIADDVIATVGTTNLDFRSLYFHFECGTCLYRTSTIAAIKNDYLQTLQHCQQIREKDCKTNLLGKILQDVFRLFAPLM
ncbi:MAG: cardiolipin synthase, partial [Clostridia bacterium]|nr:cardiolipin synthase [Clostridia bacterium]